MCSSIFAFCPSQYFWSHGVMGSLSHWDIERANFGGSYLPTQVTKSKSEKTNLQCSQKPFSKARTIWCMTKTYMRLDFSKIAWITSIARMSNDMFNMTLKTESLPRRVLKFIVGMCSWNQSIPRYDALFWIKMQCPWRHSFFENVPELQTQIYRYLWTSKRPMPLRIIKNRFLDMPVLTCDGCKCDLQLAQGQSHVSPCGWNTRPVLLF